MAPSQQIIQRHFWTVIVSLFCGFSITPSATAASNNDSPDLQGGSSSVPSIMVFEDGDDGSTAGWDVYDNDPAGATIANVYDSERDSNVIELSGSASGNGYRFRNNDGSYWHNNAFPVIEWSMRYDEPFIVYIIVQTKDGLRYLSYTPASKSSLGTGSYIHHGLGASSQEGSWQTFTRDLGYDLKQAQPDNKLQAIRGFLIRGSGRVDDIKTMETLPSDLDTDGDGLSDIEEMTVFDTDPYQRDGKNDANIDGQKPSLTYASVVTASAPKIIIYEDGKDETGVEFTPLSLALESTTWEGTVSYEYNRLGRLTKATTSNGVVTAYAYDAAGNRENVNTTGAKPLVLSASSSLSASPASKSDTDLTTVQSLPNSGQLHISAPHQIPIEGEDQAIYGWNDRSNRQESIVTAAFESNSKDRLLHIQGYAIDTPNTVGLWLNDTLLGYLSAEEGGAMGIPSLWLLPANLQVSGDNRVTLQPKANDQSWGITRLGIYPMGSSLGNLQGLKGGDQSHAEGFELHLFSQDSLQAGYQIDLAGWDINSNKELNIELNTVSVTGLEQTDYQAWGPVTPLWITPELLQPGDNKLLINNHDGMHEPWGVRIEGIQTEDAAQVNDLTNE